MLEAEGGAELATLPPISYRSPGPIQIRVPIDPTETPEPVPALVELDPDPPLSDDLKEVRRMLLEQAGTIAALRSELSNAQGAQLTALLDSHERVEAAKERARLDAAAAAKERGEWNVWLRKLLTTALGILTIAGHTVAAYVLGRPDTQQLAEQVIRYVLGGEL